MALCDKSECSAMANGADGNSPHALRSYSSIHGPGCYPSLHPAAEALVSFGDLIRAQYWYAALQYYFCPFSVCRICAAYLLSIQSGIALAARIVS